jgi:hypothetical protein
MLCPAQNLAEQIDDWEFIELWVDSIVFLPRILRLVGEQISKCCIYDLSANYKLLFLSSSYDDKADWWLGEDEYERVDGKLLASEIVGDCDIMKAIAPGSNSTVFLLE